MGIGIGEHDVAIPWRTHLRAVVAHANGIACRNPVVAGPGAGEVVLRMVAINDLGQAQEFNVCPRGWRRFVHQPQMRQRVANRPVGHLGCGGVVVLAAFQRDRVAARSAHVFGGAHAVAGVGAEQPGALGGVGARQTLLHAHRVGGEPALDDPPGAEPQRQGLLQRRVAHRFQITGIVGRANHGKRFTPGPKGMQVQQYVVSCQQGAQHVGDAVFIVLWVVAGPQVAVQVAVPVALALAVGQGVGDRHQSQAAADHRECTTVQLGQHPFNAPRATGFAAVHGTGHHQPRTGLQRGELVNP